MIETVKKIYNFLNQEHSSYEMIKDGVTSFVPLDEANTDYQAILTWISEGNTVIDNPPE